MKILYEIKTKMDWCNWAKKWKEFDCESDDLETVAEKYLEYFYEKLDGTAYFRSKADKMFIKVKVKGSDDSSSKTFKLSICFTTEYIVEEMEDA